MVSPTFPPRHPIAPASVVLHFLLQAPQLSGSVSVAVHVEPQSTCVPGHPEESFFTSGAASFDDGESIAASSVVASGPSAPTFVSPTHAAKAPSVFHGATPSNGAPDVQCRPLVVVRAGVPSIAIVTCAGDVPVRCSSTWYQRFGSNVFNIGVSTTVLLPSG